MKTHIVGVDGYGTMLHDPGAYITDVVSSILETNEFSGGDFVTFFRHKGKNERDDDEGTLETLGAMRKEVERYVDSHNSAENNLILVGKSIGGVNVFKVFENVWSHLDYRRIVLFTVDAHWKPAGYPKNDLQIDGRAFEKLDLKWMNYFQKNKYPRGANAKNATENHNLTGIHYEADNALVVHMNIIHYPAIKENLTSCMRWVRES